jgi:isochorismate synthase
MPDRIRYRLPGDQGLKEIEGCLVPGLQSGGFVLSKFSGEQWTLMEGDSAHTTQRTPPKSISKEDYIQKVGTLVNDLRQGPMRKLVFSRTISVSLPESWAIEESFENLLENRPNAFVYLLESDQLGTWIGASPEVLLKGGNASYETYSLAGTRPVGDDNWTEKELEEQAMLSEFISEVLDGFGDYTQAPLDQLQAGNVQHLLNRFEFRLLKGELPKLLGKLHPTPAVSGLPVGKAIEEIHAREGYSRDLYTGFIGEFELGQATNLYVNLRCAQIIGEEAIIYVGGGITEDSVPENEWQETELKAATMLHLLS